MAEAPTAEALHDDWDRHWSELGAESGSNPAVGYRAKLITRLLERDGAPRRLLDLGAGVGDLLVLAAARWPGAELAGTDISAEGIRLVGERVPRITGAVLDLTDDQLEVPASLRGWATHAVCSEVLEHVDEPVALLRNGAKLLAPGCLLIVTVPSGEISAFDRHLGHRRHYTAELLGDQIREAGLELTEIRRAGFPFFNLYRALVRMRGERLIADAGAGTGAPSAAARAAMAVFRLLFALNLDNSSRGEQLVAVARRP